MTGVFGRREAGSTIDEVMKFTGPATGILFVVAGVTAFGFAMRALVTHRERSFVVWLAVLFGVLAMLFLAAELLLPH